jgi:hypothetical protein
MSSTIRIAGALLAPLALGACGLPIGVQIASLFADGVSYLTTDKSLTDHGISAVTGEDCALWRGVEGANICHEPASDKEAETIVAALGKPKAPTSAPVLTAARGDADLPTEVFAEAPESPPAKPSVIALNERKPKPVAKVAAPITADAMILGTELPPTQPAQVRQFVDTSPLPAPATKPATTGMVAEALPPPPPAPPAANPEPKRPIKLAQAKLEQASVKLPAKAAAKRTISAGKATYYVIASYRRAADAAKFAKRNPKTQAQVIEGTADGRQVFRVAVGPIDRKDSGAIKARLKQAGFKDTWRLTLNSAPVETEVATLR